MATEAHCIYCFETLASRFEKRKALTLQEVQSLWQEYIQAVQDNVADVEPYTADSSEQVLAAEDDDNVETHQHNLRPRQISKLQSESPAGTSNASTPSNASSKAPSSEASKASSRSSLFSSLAGPSEEEYPLFVTWNTISSQGNKSLRGCIGTFEDQSLSRGLREYALTSAFNDHRFSPISASEFPSLACDITLLLNFTPCNDAMDWEIGTHGLRISFTSQGRRHGSTYLPQVAPEQGWTKEETIVSLMRKAGWSGRSSDWQKVPDLKCIRYEGKKADLDYSTFKTWRTWVEART